MGEEFGGGPGFVPPPPTGGGGGGGATCATAPELLCLAGRFGTANNPIISLDIDGIITGSDDDAHGLVLRSSPGAVSTSYFAVELDTPTEIDGDPGTGNFGFLVQDAPLTLAHSGYFTGLVLGVNQADWTLKSGVAGIGGIVFGNSQFKLHPAPGESQTVAGVEAFEDDSQISCDNGGSLYILNGINGVGMYQQLEAVTAGSVLHVGPIYGIDFNMGASVSGGGVVNVDRAVGLHYAPALSPATVGDAIGLDYDPQLGTVTGVRATVRSVDPLAPMLHAGFVRLGDDTHLGLLKIADGVAHDTTLTAQAQAVTIDYTLPAAPPAVNGYVLSATIAGVMSWIAAGSGTPAPPDRSVQFNNAGAFGGDALFNYTINDLGNPRVLIGTTTDPTVAIGGVGVAELACFSNSLGDDGWFFATSYIFGAAVTSNSVGVAPQFLGTRARGTIAAILPVLDGDILMQVTGNGISSDGSLSTVSGTTAYVVDGAPSPGIVPSGFSVGVVDLAGDRQSRFNVDRDGRVGIGGQLGLILPFRPVTSGRRAGALLHVQSIFDTEPTSIVQAFSGQTARLTEWWDGANAVLAAVDVAGNLETIRSVSGYVWPAAHAVGVLTNDGIGNLSWTTGGAGSMGPMGVPGLDGLDGEDSYIPGPMGLTGATGATGATGPQGIPGLDGIDGEDSFIPGPQGPIGMQGVPGIMGVPGFDGEDGTDSYLPGPPGPIGATGALGPMGAAGLDGFDGEDSYIPGPAGAVGATGAQGPQGLQGIPGIAFDGEDGLDSYVVGPQGPRGIPGVQGVPGLDGEDALDFPIPGPTGATGAMGLTGPQGIPGIAFDGEDGMDSYLPGPQGLQGLPGPQGVPGLDGEDALDFPIPGPTGATGATGLTGPQGPPGIVWLDDSTWDDASVLAAMPVPGTASNITDMGNFTALGASHKFGTAGVSCTLQVGQGTTGTDFGQIIVNSGNSGNTSPSLSLNRNGVTVATFTYDGTNTNLGYTGSLAFGASLILTKAILDTNGRFSKYGNISTVLNGIPSELANIDTTGLTANVAAALLYAVPAAGAGLYRVSALVVETTAGSVSSTLPNVQIVYTDNQTGGTITIDATPVLGVSGIGQTGALTANTIGTTSAGVIVINAKASTNINYQTVNYASTAAGMTYAVHIRLEALG